MLKSIKAGLIGFGNAGKFYHAPYINCVPGFHLYKIRETKPQNIQYAADMFPDTIVVTDSRNIIDDKEVDLVIIAAPSHMHVELAKKALMAGKHVVVDKPFALKAWDADELMTLAEDNKRVLTVYHNRRFASDFKTVKHIVESGRLGDVVDMELNFDRFNKSINRDWWKDNNLPGSGLLYEIGPHLIDMAICLFGLPDQVFAHLRILRKEAMVTDCFEIILSYPHVKVALKASMLAKDPRPQFAIYGTNGSFLKYGMDIQESDIKKGLTPKTKTPWGYEPEDMWGTLTTNENGIDVKEKIPSLPGNYGYFYENLYQHICNEAQLAVKPQEAREGIKIIELCLQSQAERKMLSFKN